MTEVRINGLMELIEFLNKVKYPGEWVAVNNKEDEITGRSIKASGRGRPGPEPPIPCGYPSKWVATNKETSNE